MKRHSLILIASGTAFLGIVIVLGVRLASPEKVLAWRIRHGYSVEMGGVKFHMPPRFELYSKKPLEDGSMKLVKWDRNRSGAIAFYLIETRDVKEPDLSPSRFQRLVKLQPATLAGRGGSCAEFSETREVEAFDPRFTIIDCYFGPQIGVRFFGRAQSVPQFYEFIRRAE